MGENSKHTLETSSPDSPERPSKVTKTEDFREEHEEQQLLNVVEQPMNPNPGVQRYLVAIEYIGSRFSGSQKQPKCRTVVGVLEEAFHKFIGQPVSVFCSSRTDAGVHALSNVCHVDVERISKRKPGEVLPPHEPAVVRRAVNHFLQEACRVLVGFHDFSSFRAAGCQANSPIRTLDELSVSEVHSTPYFPSVMEREQSNLNRGDPHPCSRKSQIDQPIGSISSNGGSSNDETRLEFGIRRWHRCYVVTARARSFLYHQVRLLVGVLKCVGTGELTVSDVERILNAKTVTAASPMAPACGLYLGQVEYDLS
ncbi:uncharacterized protein LOC110809976 isoform X3 [Carica papaya]|uniref:uncharacterized protein LOC110809976 isoform X3 n=1 Tax=Carica papaya TaxID=3649 RepID=UPI000B8C9F9E|nr:uncharacterized protein LOC110809976 isoform X3 [Carica papaya]